MNSLCPALLVASFLAASVTAFAQDGQSPKPTAPITLQLPFALPKVLPMVDAAYLGKPVDCKDIAAQCDVIVTVSEIFDGGKLIACIVTVTSEVQLKTDKPRDKFIVFKLQMSSSKQPPVASYSFLPKFGIFIVSEKVKQLEEVNTGLTSEFRLKHKNLKNSEAVFLPLVIQTLTTGEPPQLCAAADPRIVNE